MCFMSRLGVAGCASRCKKCSYFLKTYPVYTRICRGCAFDCSS